MRRREFFTLIGGTVIVWSFAASADASVPVVAFVSGRSQSGDDPYLPAMQKAFAESGLVDGKTMTFAARWAEGQYGRVPELTKELIARGASVIITIGTAVDRALLFCYHYDPETGKYGLAIMNLVRFGGIVTVAGVVSFILFNLRRRPQTPAVMATATDKR